MLKFKWIFLAFIAGFIFIFLLKTVLKNEIKGEIAEPEFDVYVTKVKQKTIAPLISGFGTIKPKVQWQSLAEVSGAVTYKNAKLARGEFIEKDTLLFKLDDLPYQLALAKALASKASVETEAVKLEIEKARLQTSLAIESKKLLLEKNEYTRQKSLNTKGGISNSQLEKQQLSVFAQTLKENELQASVKQLPARKNAIDAELMQAESLIKQAQLDLSHTEISMPFSGRIETVDVELGEFVAIGRHLLSAQDFRLLEVEAKISIHQIHQLMSSLAANKNISDTSLPNIEAVGLDAKIKLSHASLKSSWNGKVTRISGQVDARVGTVGLIVEIPFNFKMLKDKPRGQLPVISGMFVEVQVEARSVTVLTVPKQALHGERLYLVDQDSRLQILPVEVLFIRDNDVAIAADSLKAGQQIVVSDLLPVSTGLKLKSFAWSEEL